MTEDQSEAKLAVLECFRAKPEFEHFLDVAHRQEGKKGLLRWLDESGLALYLHRQLSSHAALESVEPGLREALQRRLDANRDRTKIMLSEFERVNAALQRDSIPYVVVKGFSLTDEFCPEPWLRHQADIDVLVEGTSVPLAKRTACALGYVLEEEDPLGELKMAIRSEHVPSSGDFLYGPPQHLHLEIHRRFYEPECGVSLNIGDDWHDHVVMRRIGSVEYPCLELPYRFATQMLHAFRHINSWIRMSWLYEIGYFVDQFRDNEQLWDSITGLTGADRRVQNAFGVVASLVGNAFGTEFPTVARQNWIEPLPAKQRDWIERYSVGWMLSDFGRGDKSGLILQREFADSTLAWWSYRASRAARLLRMTSTGHADLQFSETLRKQADYVWRSVQWNLKGILHRHETDRT